MQTPENFTSLSAFLRPPKALRADTSTEPDDQIHELEPVTPREEQSAGDDVRLFRASVAEALDCAIEELCRDLASEVLARELMLMPVDVKAICKALLERYTREVPVAIRVHPQDCEVLHDLEVPIRADPRLRPGDVMLDVANGTLDASLAVRLEHVLCKQQR